MVSCEWLKFLRNFYTINTEWKSLIYTYPCLNACVYIYKYLCAPIFIYFKIKHMKIFPKAKIVCISVCVCVHTYSSVYKIKNIKVLPKAMQIQGMNNQKN